MIDLTQRSLTELETMMSNARRKGGTEALVQRLEIALEIQGRHQHDDPDSVIGLCRGTVALMDVCRFEETDQRRKSMRTRQGIKNHGEVGFMTRCARRESEGSGFRLLLAGGLGPCTFEYTVVAYPNLFPEDAVHAARARLLVHGVPLPQAKAEPARAALTA